MAITFLLWLAAQDPQHHLKDGRIWTKQTAKDLHKDFRWMSIPTISRALNSLEKQGLITGGNYNQFKYDQSQWWALNYEGLAKLKSIRLADMPLGDESGVQTPFFKMKNGDLTGNDDPVSAPDVQGSEEPFLNLKNGDLNLQNPGDQNEMTIPESIHTHALSESSVPDSPPEMQLGTGTNGPAPLAWPRSAPRVDLLPVPDGVQPFVEAICQLTGEPFTLMLPEQHNRVVAMATKLRDLRYTLEDLAHVPVVWQAKARSFPNRTIYLRNLPQLVGEAAQARLGDGQRRQRYEQYAEPDPEPESELEPEPEPEPEDQPAELDQVWDQVLILVQESAAPSQIALFERATLIGLDDGTAVLAVPDVGTGDLLRNRWGEFLKARFAEARLEVEQIVCTVQALPKRQPVSRRV